MSQPCNDVVAFVEGRLDEQAYEAYTDHLLGCERCQQDVHDLLQLRALAWREGFELPSLESQTPDLQTPERSFAAPRSASLRSEYVDVVGGPRAAAARQRRRRLAGTLMAIAACAAVAVVAVRLTAPTAGVALARLAPPETLRHIPVRLFGGELDAYRELDPMLSVVGAELFVDLEALGDVGATGDRRAEAAAWALAGNFDQARAALDQAPESADAFSDRAAVEVMAGDYSAALTAASRALELDPEHERAWWNRGWALERAGLLLQAATAFERARDLAEDPRWAAAAAARAESLRARVQSWRDGWYDFWKAAQAWSKGGEAPPEVAFVRYPGLGRHYFMQRLWGAGPTEVDGLRPIAARLEGPEGPLHEWLDRAAKGGAARARAAARFVDALAGHAAFEDALALATKLGSEDVALGALYHLRKQPAYHDRFVDAARRTHDPHVLAWAANQEALSLWEQSRAWEAQQVLLEGYRKAPVGLTKLTLAGRLAANALNLDRDPGLANEVLAEARELAERTRAYGRHVGLLQDSVRPAAREGRCAMAEALQAEIEAREPERPQVKAFGRPWVAACAAREHRMAWAAKYLLEVPPVSTRVLVDAFSSGASGLDAQTVRAYVQGWEAFGESGRLEREVELVRIGLRERPAAVASALRALIEEIESQPADVDMHAPRDHAYRTLAEAYARASQPERTLEAFGGWKKVQPGERCVLGIGATLTRVYAAARDASGVAHGAFVARAAPRAVDLSPATAVPASLVAALSACDEVEVIAGRPFEAAPDLLPSSVAWSFRVGDLTPRRPPPAPSRRLVVAEPLSTGTHALGLPALPEYPASGDLEATQLFGADATLANVLEGLEWAGDIEFHTHGLAGTAAAGLLLSPAPDGRDRLLPTDLRGRTLGGRPVVYLAACGAAHRLGGGFEPLGLPEAFVRAGARAVIASTSQMPALASVSFFDDVRALVDAGLSPARALQQVRAKNLRSSALHWSRHLISYSE